MASVSVRISEVDVGSVSVSEKEYGLCVNHAEGGIAFITACSREGVISVTISPSERGRETHSSKR